MDRRHIRLGVQVSGRPRGGPGGARRAGLPPSSVPRSKSVPPGRSATTWGCGEDLSGWLVTRGTVHVSWDRARSSPTVAAILPHADGPAGLCTLRGAGRPPGASVQRGRWPQRGRVSSKADAEPPIALRQKLRLRHPFLLIRLLYLSFANLCQHPISEAAQIC